MHDFDSNIQMAVLYSFLISFPSPPVHFTSLGGGGQGRGGGWGRGRGRGVPPVM